MVSIFIIRAFNDVDHFTPLIAHFAVAPDHRPIVLCVNPRFSFLNNDNIIYLKNQLNVTVEDIFKLPFRSGLKDLILIGRFLLSIIKSVLPGRVYNWLDVKSSELVINIFNRNLAWSENIAKTYKPDCFIFDWVSSKALVNENLVKTAKKFGITTYSIPHGMTLFTNFDLTNIEKQEKNSSNNTQNDFDYIVTQGKLGRMHLENEGCKPEKIAELGSLRFCREWMDTYKQNILSNDFRKPNSGKKLKVVLFLTKLHYNIKLDYVLETVEKLAASNWIYLIIKPHTRGNEISYLKKLVKKYKIDIRFECSSVHLCEWADAGLVVGSSIGLQVLYSKKLLVYLDFLDTNSSYYNEMRACVSVRNPDHLIGELQKYTNKNLEIPYTSDKVDKIFESCVYAGNKENNIIEMYSNFLCQNSKTNEKQQT